MKTCPNCGELLGDSVKDCFKCHFNFEVKRVLTSEERLGYRDRPNKNTKCFDRMGRTRMEIAFCF